VCTIVQQNKDRARARPQLGARAVRRVTKGKIPRL
jgi:hypothetical protein